MTPHSRPALIRPPSLTERYDSAADLLSKDGLVTSGHSDRSIRSALRRGELVRVCRGRYLRADHVPEWPEQRYWLRVRAVADTLDGDSVFSHESAAALHQLPLWGFDLDAVHTTRAQRPAGTRVQGRRIIYRLPLRPADDRHPEVVRVCGIQATSVARTLVDLARIRDQTPVVCAADAALRRGLCSASELETALRSPGSSHGAPRARLTLRHVAGASESVAETRSRLTFTDARLPTPRLQAVIETPSGNRYRVDFLWEDKRVIGECDGLGKYLDGADGPADTRERLRREKVRENELQSMGYVVVRWTWDDLNRPDELVQRISAVLRSR